MSLYRRLHLAILTIESHSKLLGRSRQGRSFSAKGNRAVYIETTAVSSIPTAVIHMQVRIKFPGYALLQFYKAALVTDKRSPDGFESQPFVNTSRKAMRRKITDPFLSGKALEEAFSSMTPVNEQGATLMSEKADISSNQVMQSTGEELFSTTEEEISSEDCEAVTNIPAPLRKRKVRTKTPAVSRPAQAVAAANEPSTSAVVTEARCALKAKLDEKFKNVPVFADSHWRTNYFKIS